MNKIICKHQKQKLLKNKTSFCFKNKHLPTLLKKTKSKQKNIKKKQSGHTHKHIYKQTKQLPCETSKINKKKTAHPKF